MSAVVGSALLSLWEKLTVQTDKLMLWISSG